MHVIPHNAVEAKHPMSSRPKVFAIRLGGKEDMSRVSKAANHLYAYEGMQRHASKWSLIPEAPSSMGQPRAALGAFLLYQCIPFATET